MTYQDINNIMSELAEYQRLKDELETQIESLKDDLKKYMIDNDLTVLNGLEHKATYTAVTSTRLDTKADELETQIESLKDDLKKYMIDNDLTVLNGLEHKATYTAVTSTRLDTKALKNAHSDLVKEYIITSVSNRFTFR